MKIEILYPEVANLYGDLMNIDFLSRHGNCEVFRTSLDKRPLFLDGNISLVYLGGMSEVGLSVVLESLKQYKSELLANIEAGQRFLVTGNAIELFGKGIYVKDKCVLEGLGFFDFHSIRDLDHRYNSLYLGLFNDIEIVGFKSQFSHSYGEVPALFKTTRGCGLNVDTMNEGIFYKGFMATYVLGPLLVLNPLFCKHLLKELGYQGELVFEDYVFEVYQHRLAQFKEPNRGFTY